MWYGSSTCDEIAVQNLSMTTATELRVVIGGSTKEDAPRTCTSDLAYSLYDLELRTDADSPKKVTVVEKSAQEDHQQWTATPATE